MSSRGDAFELFFMACWVGFAFFCLSAMAYGVLRMGGPMVVRHQFCAEVALGLIAAVSLAFLFRMVARS